MYGIKWRDRFIFMYINCLPYIYIYGIIFPNKFVGRLQMGKIGQLFYLVFVFTFFLPSFAFAYIDPGTGSLILQALAAAAFSVLAFWSSLREKIKNFFKKKDK